LVPQERKSQMVSPFKYVTFFFSHRSDKNQPSLFFSLVSQSFRDLRSEVSRSEISIWTQIKWFTCSFYSAKLLLDDG